MDSCDINALIDEIKKDQRNLQYKIGILSYMVKIIVMGNTGCGKSSLTSCLSNKSVFINNGPGDDVILKGPGICSGMKSGTKKPCIKCVDYDSHLIYIDCPGFIDTHGYEHEIKNSLMIDYLFKMCATSNKCKFLLVIPATDFYSARGQDISKIIDRMLNMFPNLDELQKGIGLVITKGKVKKSALNYLEMLENNASDNVLMFCDFFKNNLDRVFTFPKAKRKNIGQKYFFNDKKRLIQFLQTDFVINPITKIQVSEEALIFIHNIRLKYYQMIKDKLLSIFCNIREKYLEEKNQFELKKWIDSMNQLINSNIKDIKELKQFFHDFVPNGKDYNDDFVSLEKEDRINNFIEKILSDDISKTIFVKSIQSLTHQAINELNEVSKKAVIREKCEKNKNDLDRKLSDLNKIEIENNKKYQDYQKMLQQKEQDNIMKLNHQREIYERQYNENVNMLLYQLNEERRKNEILKEMENERIRNLCQRIKDAENKLLSNERNYEIEKAYLKREESEMIRKCDQLSDKMEENDGKCNIC